MTAVEKTQTQTPWLALLALAGFWFAVARIISPQWSVYTQYNYGWAVPFLCLYLLWQRWADRPETTAPTLLPALVALAAAGLMLFPTRVIAEANLIWRAASWVLAGELVLVSLCVIYLAGGRSWLKHFGFPVTFFFVAIPWPSGIENLIIQNLMRVNTAIVVEFLTVLGIPALQQGNVIQISNGQVGIDEACSGIRSLQATLMMSLFFGELYRLSWRRRIGLVAAGVGIAFVCNMIRTFILVYVCNKSGMSALDKWHDPTGIGILLVCFTSLWLVATKMRRPAAPMEIKRTAWPTLKPRWLAAALLIWLVVVEAGTAAWFGARRAGMPTQTNWSIRWPADKPQSRDVALSKRVRQEMQFKEGKGQGWMEGDGTGWQMFYFSWGPADSLRERAVVQCAKTHRPEICLPAAGLELKENLGVKDFQVGGQTLPFRIYYFEDRGRPLFVYYGAWEDGTRGRVANMRESSASRLEAALDGSRSISQRVIEIAIWGCRKENEAAEALQKLLQEAIVN